ncbi:MAG: twin-arginine translocation signal domain-containing protein [Thermomicrobiales bacterium]
MDQQRFDDLSRGMARATSRRGVLKTLAGAAVGALFGLRPRDQADP